MGPVVGDVNGDGRLDVYRPRHGLRQPAGEAGRSSTRTRPGSKYSRSSAASTPAGAGSCSTTTTTATSTCSSPTATPTTSTPRRTCCGQRRQGQVPWTSREDNPASYFREKHVGRGATFGDYDNDGDLDLLIVNLNAGARLLRNDGGNRNHSLTVDARTIHGGDAVGARVTVTVGALRQIQDVVPVRGYLSQVDPRAHFGLGSSPKADRVEIRWPDGRVDTLKDVRGDRILALVQGGAEGRKPR